MNPATRYLSTSMALALVATSYFVLQPRAERPGPPRPSPALSAPRPDPIVQATGSPTFLAVAVRLRAIAVKERGNLIAAYQLRYVTTGATGRSKLSEVQAYGSDATVSATGTVTGSSSFAPYRFRYVSTPPVWRVGSSWRARAFVAV